MNFFEQWIKDRWGTFEPLSRKWQIASMGMAGEMGECMEHLKKHLRDGKVPGEALKLEFGDLLHYLTLLINSYGWSTQEVMHANIIKLNERDRIKRERLSSQSNQVSS